VSFVRPSSRKFATAASLMLLTLAAADPAAGQGDSKKKSENPQNQPALVTADQIVYDRDLNLVTARGHVEVDQGGQVLMADALSYNLKQDIVIATGKVSFTDTDGMITYADYMEVTGDMKEAASRGIRVLMIDDSRMAGSYARRTDGTLTVLEKAIYTACKPCAEDASKPPLWAVKGDRVIHDLDTHTIEYENAWLEVAGIPVAYTPYLSTADPYLKRVSGWLPPGVLTNNILGTGVRAPYFAVIDANQDVTLTPMLTSKNDAMLGATYRYKDYYGESKTTASITNLNAPNYTGKDIIGWHIDSTLLYDIDPNWRGGWQIERASDQNYLPTINIHPLQPFLTVRPYVENFTYSNYFAAEAYSFQSLTSQALPAGALIPQKDPVVFPMTTYSYVSDPDSFGGYWTFDSHTAVVSRLKGTDDRQVNTQTSWHLPITTDDGQMFRLTTTMRADAYNSDHVTSTIAGTENATRFIPDLAVDWRYPFTRVDEHGSQTITPIVMLAVSPDTGNSVKIPNNDSLDFELDDMNIFSPTPSSGFDRLVTGPRVAYGAQYTIVNRGGEAADILVGQSYQQHAQTVLPSGTGLDSSMSDIVGRTDFSPSQNVVLQYRFRLDHDNLEIRRSEVSTSLGPKPLNLNIGYVFYDRLSPTSPFAAREQMSATLSTQWSHYWSSQVYTIQNLGQQAGPLQSGVRVIYDDDCFTVKVDAGSVHTTSAVFSVGHYFNLLVVFKTLGQLPVDLF
jgi:LPS-assembly protein